MVNRGKPVVQSNYMMRRSDGALCKGLVIEIRTTPDGDAECFVHYHDYDRRFDEWIPASNVFQKLDPEECQDTGSASSSLGMGGAVIASLSEVNRLTRGQKRKFHDIQVLDKSESQQQEDGYLQQLAKEHATFTRVKYISQIQLGAYEIRTWYFSPYPKEYLRCRKLWICHQCLKYMRMEANFWRHVSACKVKRPPGKEIYHKDGLAVFEIDGLHQELYCQNLCLLAKLFLDHKTLFYDVGLFTFYILCQVDRDGFHLVGYFSKEKVSTDNNILACLMTLPPYQRHGYGKFLIDLSYELAKRENLIGGPEKPLSDLGRLSYRSYWEHAIFTFLWREYERRGLVTCHLQDISRGTAIAPEDVQYVLETHPIIKKFWVGKSVEIRPQELQTIVEDLEKKKMMKVDPTFLKYEPVVARSG